MTLGHGVATLAGAFIFPFLVRMLWDKMVKEWGSIGGLAAIVFVVLLSWTLNHGANNPFIYQAGGVWIDQAVAATVGLIVVTKLKGGSIKKASPTILTGILAGVLAGIIIYGTL